MAVPNSALLQHIVLISSILSACGATLTVAAVVAIKRLRSFPARLTFYLGLSNLMWFISILAGVSDVDSTSDSVCRIAGPLNQVFALTSIFWTTCVALHMALIITKDEPPPAHYERRYHLFAWGVPVVLVLTLLLSLDKDDATPDYTRTYSSVCYVSPEHKYLRVITQSGPSILGFLFNACAYTWALCKAHALVKQSEGEHGDEEIAAHHRAVVTRVTSSASKYLLVYLLAWTPSVTSDVMLMTGSSIHTDSDMFWLVYCFQALFFSQGFFNSLVYFLNKKHVLKAVWQGRQSSRRVSDMADAVLLRHEPDNRKDSIYDSDFYHGADAYQPPVLNVDSSFRDDYALSPASRRGALSPVLFDGRPRVASAGYALN